jgi:hypothetical protein
MDGRTAEEALGVVTNNFNFGTLAYLKIWLRSGG